MPARSTPTRRRLDPKRGPSSSRASDLPAACLDRRLASTRPTSPARVPQIAAILLQRIRRAGDQDLIGRLGARLARQGRSVGSANSAVVGPRRCPADRRGIRSEVRQRGEFCRRRREHDDHGWLTFLVVPGAKPGIIAGTGPGCTRTRPRKWRPRPNTPQVAWQGKLICTGPEIRTHRAAPRLHAARIESTDLA